MRLNVASALLFVGSLLVCIESYGQTPEGFHWVDFKRDASTVSKVERALRDEDYSVIREIGVTDAFVLVLTVRREPGQTNFWGDESRVYNISTKTWNVESLLSGYNLQIKDWISFRRRVHLIWVSCTWTAGNVNRRVSSPHYTTIV